MRRFREHTYIYMKRNNFGMRVGVKEVVYTLPPRSRSMQILFVGISIDFSIKS